MQNRYVFVPIRTHNSSFLQLYESLEPDKTSGEYKSYILGVNKEVNLRIITRQDSTIHASIRSLWPKSKESYQEMKKIHKNKIGKKHAGTR